MADGAYRWQGNTPAPDPARVEAIDADWADDQAHAFAEPARLAAVERIERALAAARTGDLTEASAQLIHARSALEGLNPAALEPRRGLAGLFDSRSKRLKRFREAYARAAASVSEVGALLTDRLDGAARRGAGLDQAWDGLRDAVVDLDAHLAVAVRRLLNRQPAADDEASADPLPARRATLDACRLAALRSLPLVRGAQGAETRSSAPLKACVEGLTNWRDDWKDALGLAGKRPKKVRPDLERLKRARDEALARIDAALKELTATRDRQAEVTGRIAELRRTL